MKILFLNMYPEYGGTEIYLQRLIENLKEDRIVEQMYLVSPKVDKLYENITINKENIFTVNTPSFKNIKNLIDMGKYIDKLIKELDINCVFLNGLRAIILKPFIKSNNIKFIATSHLSLINNQDIKTKIRMNISNQILKRSLKNIDQIIVLSENHKREMVELGVAESYKINVIYNGIDINKYRANYYRKDRKCEVIKIIEIARLHKTKGQSDLIDVASRLIKKHNNFEINLVGDGVDREKLELQIKENGLEGIVNILGFRNDIKELINESDIFILPSYIEGLPLSMLESMAMNLPVIVSNIAGIPEVITSGENGYLINPGNFKEIEEALDSLITNKELRISMGNNGRKTVENKFNDKICYEKTKQVILSEKNN